MISDIKKFFAMEASAGILLGIFAILALILKNSPFGYLHDILIETQIGFSIGDITSSGNLLIFINDGLMAIFFLLVGLEIKREIVEGELSNREQILLPAIAAIGGILLPAIVYAMLNWGNDTTIKGWAIPAATDIAFALAIITALGKKVPDSLKICLAAIAIFDDLMSIIIIAFFYTAKLNIAPLIACAFLIFILYILNKKNVKQISPYLFIGLLLWISVLKSGIHATVAGVILALFIPMNIKYKQHKSPLIFLENRLHPWVAYGILPIFAFANSAVPLNNLSVETFLNPITLGVMLGLFIGKQIGIMGVSYIAYMFKLIKLPEDVTWPQFYGLSLVCGVGFTMGLFIGGLSFMEYELQNFVRIGVLSGSILSGSLGYIVLEACAKKHKKRKVA